MNVFYDDWMALADQDSSFGSKADNHLKVSFTMSFFLRKTNCLSWYLYLLLHCDADYFEYVTLLLVKQIIIDLLHHIVFTGLQPTSEYKLQGGGG